MRITKSHPITLDGLPEFSPEAYSKIAYWEPEDGFSSEKFSHQSFHSMEELEAERAEIEKNAVGKFEIVDASYSPRSLRRILPDRWLLAYTLDKASTVINGKYVPLYSRLKSGLVFKSVVLGYGEGPIHAVLPSADAEAYIREHCSSSARLKATALRAYESVSNTYGHHTWTNVSPQIFLCLAAAKSSLDAMAAVLWALLFRETPAGNRIPSMRKLYDELKKNGGHAFFDDFRELHESSWFTDLQLARDSVVHRSANPVAHDKYGVAFDFDIGLFKEMETSRLHIGAPKAEIDDVVKQVHLSSVFKAFIEGLEQWESKIAIRLRSLAWYPSFNLEGIMMEVEFNDYMLLMDGSSPSLMITSHAAGFSSKEQFLGLHPFGQGPSSLPLFADEEHANPPQ